MVEASGRRSEQRVSERRVRVDDGVRKPAIVSVPQGPPSTAGSRNAVIGVSAQTKRGKGGGLPRRERFDSCGRGDGRHVSPPSC